MTRRIFILGSSFLPRVSSATGRRAGGPLFNYLGLVDASQKYEYLFASSGIRFPKFRHHS